MNNINKICRQFSKMNYDDQHLLLALLSREHSQIRKPNIVEKWKELLDKTLLDKINIKIDFINNKVNPDIKEEYINRFICNITIKYNDIEYTYSGHSYIKRFAKKNAIKLAYEPLKELITNNNLFIIKELKDNATNNLLDNKNQKNELNIDDNNSIVDVVEVDEDTFNLIKNNGLVNKINENLLEVEVIEI